MISIFKWSYDRYYAINHDLRSSISELITLEQQQMIAKIIENNRIKDPFGTKNFQNLADQMHHTVTICKHKAYLQ